MTRETVMMKVMRLTKAGKKDEEIARELKTSKNSVRVLRHRYRSSVNAAPVKTGNVTESFQKPIHTLPPSQEEMRSLIGCSLNF